MAIFSRDYGIHLGTTSVIISARGKGVILKEPGSRPADQMKGHHADVLVQGDNAYIAGVNRFIFHSYAHQPWTVTTPGMTMGQWGFHFNRHNTLWRTFPAWLAYLGRAQFMLQQGRVVSDALYVSSESAPCGMDLSPALPYGYHGNCVDSDTFIKKAAVKDGRVVLPSGLSVPLLIVKHTKNATPELLAKIAELAENGASILLGDRPASPLGLTNYPAADNRQAALAQQLWGDMDGKAKTSRTLGKGHVFFGVSGCTPAGDFSVRSHLPIVVASAPHCFVGGFPNAVEMLLVVCVQGN